MATGHFGLIRTLTIEKRICIFINMLFLMLPKHCADLLYIMYVSITLNGKEYFFFRTKIKTVNWIFTKTGKSNSQGGKEIPKQMTFIDLMLKGIYRVNS